MRMKLSELKLRDMTRGIKLKIKELEVKYLKQAEKTAGIGNVLC